MKLVKPLKWHGELPDEPRSIPDFDRYSITFDGRVRGVLCEELKPDFDKRGRPRVTLCKNGKTHRFLIARLLLTTFVGPCPEGMECCHEDGKETNCTLMNLRWDTHSANLLDRRKHGTAPCGEKINTAKLTVDKVLAIREARSTGEKLGPIAERYGISPTMVSLIVRRRSWQHV